MPSTNFFRSARVKETSIGVTPASPLLQYDYLISDSLKATDPFGRSETITGDRGIVEHLRLGQLVGGSRSAELALGWTDWMIERAIFDEFSPMVEAYNATADSSITDINSGTQTMLAAGAWVPGMLIQTTGNTVAGNNKVFKAQPSSGSGTIIAPAATFTANETAPAAGSRALAVGVEGATGDLVTAADGIASTALNWTLFPIPVGVAVKIAGYDDANLDVVAYVTAVAATKLSLGGLPAGWSAGVGAGKTVRVYIGDFAENGSDVITDSVLNWNTKTSPVAYEKFVGVAVNTLQIPFALNQIVKPNAGLVGFSAGISEALPSGATLTDPIVGVTKQPIKTGANIGRLIEGGAQLGSPACTQSINFSIANNLTPAGCLTSDSPVDWNPGDFEAVIEGTWRYRDKALLEKFHLGTPSSHLIWAKRGTVGYVFHVVNGVYTDGAAPVQGRNQEHVVQMKFEAQKDANGKTMAVTRFRYFT